MKPPVSIPASYLQEIIGLSRNRIVISSAQDYNGSATQSVALSVLRQAEILRLPRFFMDTSLDLVTLLKGSDVLWSEGMKPDAVMLANISIIQRDSYLSLSPAHATGCVALESTAFPLGEDLGHGRFVKEAVSDRASVQ
jgi:hypothetical protein